MQKAKQLLRVQNQMKIFDDFKAQLEITLERSGLAKDKEQREQKCVMWVL